jgi:hypothetical protein
LFTTVTASTFTLSVDKFLVTDQFTTESPTQPERPLFYAHTLQNYNPENSDFSDKTLLSVEFANYLLQTKSVTEQVTDAATGTVYNNLENTFNLSTSVFDVSYVKYSVRESGIVTAYHELLNNEPVFTPATIDDLDDFLKLKVDSKAYLTEPQPTDGQFVITMPLVTRYAYKETTGSRIRIEAPTALDIDSPWQVRVTDGRFITSLPVGVGASSNYQYRIAEFNSQSFDPFPPYRFHPEEKGTWLNANLFRAARNIVRDSGLNLYVTVVTKDSSGTVQAAYTNDPDKIGTVYTGSVLYEDKIASVDETNGFVEIDDTLSSSDTIVVSYYSIAQEYEFTEVDFNPTTNRNILDQRIVIYVAPETSATGDLTETLHWLSVNPLGEITYSSQADIGTTAAVDQATLRLLNEDFDTNGVPIHTFYHDKTSTASGLLYLPSGQNQQFADEFSFVDKYTVESILLASGVPTDAAQLQNYRDNSRFLILAELGIGEASAPRSLEEFDVRVQGGGIKPDRRSDAVDIQPEIAFFWDDVGGLPYPGMGACMVEVPQDLLSDFGGSFTEGQIRQIVEHHLDAGSYAIIKNYGIDPTISGITVGSGLLHVGWPSYGDDVTYNMELSLEEEVDFTAQNPSELADSTTGNYYIASGLLLDTKYFIRVTAVQDSLEHKGPTTFATTTAT